MTHRCNPNCSNTSDYNEPIKSRELYNYSRLGIGLSVNKFQEYTNSFTREGLAMYHDNHAFDNCIVFFKSDYYGDFERLIFTNCFAKKDIDGFNKLCAHSNTDYVCCNPNHYEITFLKTHIEVNLNDHFDFAFLKRPDKDESANHSQGAMFENVNRNPGDFKFEDND